MSESEEELKSLLIRVKEESEKAGLKLSIQKSKVMVSSPITSWQIEGGKLEQWHFIFLGSKVTVDSDCRHEIKRCLFLGRKAITNVDSILKSRDITLPTRVRIVKAMVFPVVVYRCESWTIKKAECWRIDAFEFWCWGRLLESLGQQEIKPVNPKGSQPWIFTGRTDAEAKAQAPTLWSPDVNRWLIGKEPDAGKDWRQKKKRWQRIRCLDGITNSVAMNLG